MELSSYQKVIADWYEANLFLGKHLEVNAVAGSGKTTLLTVLAKMTPSSKRIVAVAFNKDIASAMKQKLPSWVGSMTCHSFGRQALVNTFGGFELNERKVFDFVSADPQMKFLAYKVAKLVGLCKTNANPAPNDAYLWLLCILYDVEIDNDDGTPNDFKRKKVFEWTKKALVYSLETPNSGDFNDMLFVPAVMDDVVFTPYDGLFVDELQDTAYVQRLIIRKSIHAGSTVVGVGDRMQAIYAWRGAGHTSMDDFRDDFNTGELPLSLSYRCPSRIRDLVRQKFPAIDFNVPDSAVSGSIADIDDNDFLKTVQDNDMVLCRVNSDLVEKAMALIRSGKRASIRGRDIGKGLYDLITKSKAKDVPELFLWLDAWRARELEKASRIENDSKAQSINEKFDTLLAISDNATSVQEISARCNTLFSDDKKQGVQLSTVHKAKGLEAERVFILRPDLMPHPAAKSADDMQTEANVEYVAITRTLNELRYVR